MSDVPYVPDPRITITRAEKSEELFMSWGLLHELLAATEDMGNIPLVAATAPLREKVLGIVLARRNENGVITEPVNFFTLSVSPEDIQRIFKWVCDHCLNFMIGAMEAVVQTHKPQAGRMEARTI